MNNSIHQEARSTNPVSLIDGMVYLIALFFIFTIPWENAIRIPGIGTISKLVGMPLISFWVLTTLATGHLRKINSFFILAFLYIFWCALTMYWSVDYESSFRQTKTFIQLFLSALIIWNVLSSYQRCLTALQVLVIGSWVVIGYVYYNYSIGNVSRWTQRSSITGVDENDVALVLSLSLSISWFLATHTFSHRFALIQRIFNFLYLPAAMIAIIMTGSRGGFSSSIPALLYILLSLKNSSSERRIHLHPLISLIFVALSVFLIVKFLPSTPFQRIATTFEHVNTLNISGRWDIWVEGMQLWYENSVNSVIGIGTGGYLWSVGKVAHSTPVSVLIETGLIGLILFSLIIASLFLSSLYAERALRSFIIALIVTWAIGVTVLSWEYRKPTWVIWSLITATLCSSSGRYKFSPE